LSPDLSLETHVLDVVNLIKWEDLSDIVLCGHSYGGAVIGVVADRLPDRIRSLVYLDAFVLEDGENILQHVPEQQRDTLVEQTNMAGGWKVPPIPAEIFNVNANDREWVNRQCTMQPISTFQQHISLSGGIKSIKNVTYIYAAGFVQGSPFPPFFEKAKAKGWKTRTMSCGHDAMLDRPEEVTSLLLDAAV